MYSHVFYRSLLSLSSGLSLLFKVERSPRLSRRESWKVWFESGNLPFSLKAVLFSEHTVAATHVSTLSETLYIYFLTVRLRKKEKIFFLLLAIGASSVLEM